MPREPTSEALLLASLTRDSALAGAVLAVATWARDARVRVSEGECANNPETRQTLGSGGSVFGRLSPGPVGESRPPGEAQFCPAYRAARMDGASLAPLCAICCWPRKLSPVSQFASLEDVRRPAQRRQKSSRSCELWRSFGAGAGGGPSGAWRNGGNSQEIWHPGSATQPQRQARPRPQP